MHSIELLVMEIPKPTRLVLRQKVALCKLKVGSHLPKTTLTLCIEYENRLRMGKEGENGWNTDVSLLAGHSLLPGDSYIWKSESG